MESKLFSYLLEGSLSLSAITACYYLIFRRLTFYGINRWFLLGGIFLSVLLPLLPDLHEVKIQKPVLNDLVMTDQPAVETEFAVEEALSTSGTFHQASESPNWGSLFFYAYWSGVVVMLSWFLFQLSSSFRIFFMAKRVRMCGESFFTSPEVSAPFTLFSRIFIPESWCLESWKIDNAVLEHERVHANEQHWIDIFTCQLLVCIFWFLPLAFLLRKAVKLNLEFLADRKALKKYADLLSYQKLLLQQYTFKLVPAMAQPFYSSPLKVRLIMMKKTVSSPIFKLAYLLLIPIIGISLVAFSHESKTAIPPNLGIKNEASIYPFLPGPSFFADDTVRRANEFTPNHYPLGGSSNSRVSSSFGMRVHPILKVEKFHKGVDLAAPLGTPIYAAGSGVVTASITQNKGYGNLLKIKHNDSGYESWYGQMQRFVVKEGDLVSKGQLIGYVGSSGDSTAPHLHFEIRKEGEPIDPEQMFKC